MNALQVQDVSHSFGDRQVLRGIDFDVQPGEIVAIMGSSGGGKTTLLKCIGGLLTPTAGDILLDGESVVRHPERHRGDIGLVFQYAALFDSLNVRDNILFGLRRQSRMTPQAEKETVDYLLQVVRLDDIGEKLPSELSGGMRKRVGLARALAMKPKVLLYDEPTSGLDPVTAYSIDQLIVETREQIGVTSVVVSHDVNSVFRVADRIAFLHLGELLYWGDLEGFRASTLEPIRELLERASAERFDLGR